MPTTYIVQPGDSLSKIAQRFYRNQELWPLIQQANVATIVDPGSIFAGQAIAIPDIEGAQDLGETTIDLPPTDGGPSAMFSLAEIRGAFAGEGAGAEVHWPPLAAELQAAGCFDLPTVIAVLATIRVEVPPFAPIREFGDEAYFTRMYEGRVQLGNVEPGDGARYCGRGFIQVTGRANYRDYGAKLGVDLLAEPDRALEPEIASRILVRYFVDRGIPALAAAGDWQGVRRAVNGGLNGWDQFIDAVTRLVEAAKARGIQP
jgi:hypothetical protein